MWLAKEGQSGALNTSELLGINLSRAGLHSGLALAARAFPCCLVPFPCLLLLSPPQRCKAALKSCALGLLVVRARALHTPLGPHLDLVTVLEGKVSLPVLLTPRAILLRIAHNGVDIPMAVKARVEMQHEGAAVLPHIHSKPGETERRCKGGACSAAPDTQFSLSAHSRSSGFPECRTNPFTIFSLTLWHQTGSSL